MSVFDDVTTTCRSTWDPGSTYLHMQRNDACYWFSMLWSVAPTWTSTLARNKSLGSIFSGAEFVSNKFILLPLLTLSCFATLCLKQCPSREASVPDPGQYSPFRAAALCKELTSGPISELYLLSPLCHRAWLWKSGSQHSAQRAADPDHCWTKDWKHTRGKEITVRLLSTTRSFLTTSVRRI